MAMDQPLEIMFDHDLWATTQILDACEKLTPEQFGRKFEMGPGSLQMTLTHMIGAMRRWADSLAGRPFGPRLDQDGKAYSVPELRALLQQTAAEFRSLVQSKPLSSIMTRELNGKTYRFTYATVATQVLTHGMHHRAQCLNMLRQVGVAPLPKSSVLEWALMTGQ